MKQRWKKRKKKIATIKIDLKDLHVYVCEPNGGVYIFQVNFQDRNKSQPISFFDHVYHGICKFFRI